MEHQTNSQLQNQYQELPENCSNARYLDIQAKKLMGSGSFGKFTTFLNQTLEALKFNFGFSLQEPGYLKIKGLNGGTLDAKYAGIYF